jgi:hypothetical protein
MFTNPFNQIQFAADVDEARKVVESTKEFGGATMNASTGKLLPAGTQGVVIGGAPRAATGKPIKTKRLYKKAQAPAEHLTIMDVLNHRDRIRRETGMNPTVTVGTWNPTQEDIEKARPKRIEGINVDAGTLHYTPEDVDRTFKARPQELAGTDLTDISTVDNPYYVAPKNNKKGK